MFYYVKHPDRFEKEDVSNNSRNKVRKAGAEGNAVHSRMWYKGRILFLGKIEKQRTFVNG